MNNNQLSKERSIFKQRMKYVVTDWVTTSIAFFCFNIFRFHYIRPRFPFTGFEDSWPTLTEFICAPKIIIESIIVPLVFLGVYWLSGFYNRPFDRSRLQELLTTFFSAFINSLLFYLAALTNDNLMMRRESWLLIIVLFSFLFGFTYIGRFIIGTLTMRHFKRGEWKINTIIMGDSTEARKEANKLLRRPDNNIEIIGFYHIEGDKSASNPCPAIPVIYDLEEVCRKARNKEIDQVIIVPSRYIDKETTVLRLLYHLFPYEIGIRIKPDLMAYMTPAIRQLDIKAEPYQDISSPAVSESSKNIKRLADIVISGILLIVLSPLFAVLAIAVKRSSKGPVIYKQKRIGLHGKEFNIYKFRSMRSDAEAKGPQLSSDSDSRITPLGHTLRKYRLDELPQFWNVLKGDMSLVGPRPERAFFIEKIMKRAPWYSLVHQVRPGITSWGMVRYGYASTVDQMIERNRFDMVYMANMSILIDLKILVYTIRTVFTGKGI